MSSDTAHLEHPPSPAQIRRYIRNGHGGISFRAVKDNDGETAPLLNMLPQVNVVPSPQPPAAAAAMESRDSQSPLKLFFQDAGTFGHITTMLPDALIPLHAKDDGDVALTHSWRGRRDELLIGFVSVLQLLLLPLAVVGWFVMPGLVFLLIGGALYAFMNLMRKMTQGPRLVHSKALYHGEPANDAQHNRERWVFINGIMTGCALLHDSGAAELTESSHIGLQSAVDGLARVFRRPVLGIHNET